MTVGRIIKENRNPSYEVLKKIALAYREVDLNWLITGEGLMLKPSSERGAWDGSRSWDTNPLPQHTGQPLDRQQQGTGLSQFSIDATVEYITENEQAFERSFSFRKYMETKCSRAELDT